MNINSKYYKTILVLSCLLITIFYNQCCCAVRIYEEGGPSGILRICSGNVYVPDSQLYEETQATEVATLLKNPQSSYRYIKITSKILPDDLLIILKALQHNKTVTTLDISNNNISAEDAEAIAKTLEENDTLTTLDIGINAIGVDGAKAIAKTLENNNALTTLNIANNNIGVDGAKAIAKALENNNTLATLNISQNNIRAEGAKAIAKALENNNTLATLDIRHNYISDDGAKTIAKALEKNKTLTRLAINNLGNDGARAIETTIALDNFTLLTVESYNEISSPLLNASLERNKLIERLCPRLNININQMLSDEIRAETRSIIVSDLLKITLDYAEAPEKRFMLYMIMNNNIETIEKVLGETLTSDDKALIIKIVKAQEHIIDLLQQEDPTLLPSKDLLKIDRPSQQLPRVLQASSSSSSSSSSASNSNQQPGNSGQSSTSSNANTNHASGGSGSTTESVENNNNNNIGNHRLTNEINSFPLGIEGISSPTAADNYSSFEKQLNAIQRNYADSDNMKKLEILKKQIKNSDLSSKLKARLIDRINAIRFLSPEPERARSQAPSNDKLVDQRYIKTQPKRLEDMVRIQTEIPSKTIFNNAINHLANPGLGIVSNNVFSSHINNAGTFGSRIDLY